MFAWLLVACAQEPDGAELTSGRPIPPEEACYDVKHYDLSVTVLPETRSIQGELKLTFTILQPTHAIVLDLDDHLTVQKVSGCGDLIEPLALPFSHQGGELRVEFAEGLEAGKETRCLWVRYSGSPREAPRPPWDGGFVWAKTPSGAPWIATANQMHITKKGKVFASVRADSLVIDGFLQGDATSLSGVRITKSGKVTATIRAAWLSLEPGATLVGEVRIGPAEVPEIALLAPPVVESQAPPERPVRTAVRAVRSKETA